MAYLPPFGALGSFELAEVVEPALAASATTARIATLKMILMRTERKLAAGCESRSNFISFSFEGVDGQIECQHEFRRVSLMQDEGGVNLRSKHFFSRCWSERQIGVIK